MAKFHIPIDPNPQCFVQVGEIATRWSWVENQVSVLIRELLRLKKPEANLAIQNMMARTKLEVLSTLAQYAFTTNPLRDQIVSACCKMEKFSRYRNDVIHGLWVHRSPTDDRLAVVIRRNLKQKIDPKPDRTIVAELASKITSLREIQAEAQRLTDEVKNLKGNFD
jgi:hypothetical protein